MAINKEALAKLIAEQTGQEFNSDLLTDDMLAEVIIPEEIIDEDDEINEETIEETIEENIDEENDGSLKLEDIDRATLDPSSQLLYDVFMNERKREKAREISALVNGSGLTDKSRDIVDRLVKTGADADEIRKTIDGLKELESLTSKALGKTIVVPRGKVKKTVAKKESDKPKIGTAEYGKYLASLRK